MVVCPGRFRRFALCLLILAIQAPALPPQSAGEAVPDALSLIGYTLEALVNRFGVPASVYTVRGEAEWQDDVVFVYDAMDCYIFKDRVWQIGLRSYGTIKLGDSRPKAVLELGGGVLDDGNRLRLPLAGRGWPLELQINLDTSGAVAGIFVSRSDF